MSHFLAVQTKFRDRDALVKALREVGGWRPEQVEVHEGGQEPLLGYDGTYRDRTDPAMNRHTRDRSRAVTAEVVVRARHVGSAANDLGFRRGADGSYEALVSGHDQRSNGYSTERRPGTWMSRVAQRYAVAVTTAEASRRGYRVEEKAENGRIELALVRAW